MSDLCESPGCTVLKHPDVNNNGGLYCCNACKSTPGTHGPVCTSKLDPAVAAVASEPAPAVAEPVPAVAEPAPAVAEHAPAVAEPAPAVAEPVSAVAELVSAVAEPVSAVAEPAPAVAEPVPAVAEPAPAVSSETAPAPIPVTKASVKAEINTLKKTIAASRNQRTKDLKAALKPNSSEKEQIAALKAVRNIYELILEDHAKQLKLLYKKRHVAK